jgi:glycosyl transferase family 87
VSRRAAAAALAVLVLGFAATLWVGPWSDERVSDLFVYRQAAEPVLHGQLPYRDVFLEYPPLAAPVIALPGLAGTGEDAYRLAFAGLTLALAAAVVLLCGALAARTGGDPRKAMLAAALAPLLCGAMIRTHFDLAPVVLTLGALLLLCRGLPRLGLAVLGLGAMTKGFPLVAVPAAIAWVGARDGRRTAAGAAVALVLAMALPGALALAASPDGAWNAVRYQLERPVQIESTPAQVLRALDALGLGHARSVNSHRSDGLEHAASGAVTGAFAGLLLVVLTLFAVAAGRAPPDARGLVLASLASVAAFAAFGKVLSPQFMIWLVPLMALAFAWRMQAIAATAAGAIALTLVEFPSRYFDLVDREPFPVTVVVVRDALLLVLLALAGRRLFGGHQQLLDRRSAPVGPGLDEHGVEPGILVRRLEADVGER